MATSVLSRKKGVIVGDDVLNLFKYAQEKKFAIPAIVCCIPACQEKIEPLTNAECHILIHRGSVPRGCARRKGPRHSADVTGRRGVFRRKGDCVVLRGLGVTADKRSKGVANGDQQASIAGAIAGAHYIRAIAPSYGIPVILHTDHCAKKLLPWLDGMMDEDEKHFKEHGEPLFSSHMIDLSEEDVEWNIQTTAKYLKRAAPMKQWLEMVRNMTSTGPTA